MVRTLLVGLGLLVAAAVPAQAAERDFHRDQDFRYGQERFEHRGYYHPAPAPYAYVNPYGYVRTSRCQWQPGYWVNQVYPNDYGGYAYVPQFVPPQWVCG